MGIEYHIIHYIKIARGNNDVNNGFHIIGKVFILTDADLHVLSLINRGS